MDDRFNGRRSTYRIDDEAHVVTVVDVARRCDVCRT
jgi:hypothetical protein